MVVELNEALKEVLQSKEYESFSKEHQGYYLAHGFIQLEGDFSGKKSWQIGFYSPENDNLGVFETQPVKFQPLQDAFKDGGTISQLQDPKDFIPTETAISKIKKLLEEKHSHEVPHSGLIIVQVINDIPVYNITIITAAFSMITTHINALTGELVKENKSSVLDLKKNEK
ncbi:MAG: hypothetical protein KC535_01645 [Nanoarchaeota archaeon]|nr:hypothetical protein [Nanoarchaeota archaeon]